MVSGQAAPGTEVEVGFENPRLNTILKALSPAERAVALALATNGVTTWAEAAMTAGAAQPKIQGEKVRRKVMRLAAAAEAITVSDC
ncbi:alpha-D-ribose 1-methylphosphonate 5-triphosphate synthase subunit PhnH [Streptomyces achromogenes]|uniref:Alpha-D-ribose 1-methylphosphonate 5-triphosphate synthase subunit PhnH n=1 Tax=Streptomyces achromogenes TaxID=67255 RepID=A0ABU0QE59_STRAH|nr:hypothetical protein [Streptomyces achromogenes]MDQ0688939.1 alpha-D-ribose 1-methylphosphonate 5-triphosphate synthase subunit PhnH [Streptomyces achromogenes]